MKKLALLLLIFSTYAFGHPYQIVIFRHAEKVLAEGHIGDLNAKLNAQGQQRAAYLVDFLLQKKIINEQQHPISAIYVPRSFVKSPEGTYDYVRCTQTIIPLYHQADAFLKETKNKLVYFNSDYPYIEAKSVLNDIMKHHFDGETVVICWEHTHIPHLFTGEFEKLKSSLPHLGEDIYDIVWVIRFENDQVTGLSFTQVPTNGFNYPAMEDPHAPAAH